MTEPLEVTPNVPPDWRDWINAFPTMKSLAVFCFYSWVLTPAVMIFAAWLVGNEFVTSKDAIAFIEKMFDKWLDALNWLTLAAVFGVVTKFATTKPDVIRAEGEVKAKTIAAAAQADAVKAVGQSGQWPAIPAASAARGYGTPTADEAAILAAEEAARIEKHRVNPPTIEGD